MVTTFYPPYHFGGDAVFVYRLANELAGRGHSVDVVHCVEAFEVSKPRGVTAGGNFPNHPNVTVHALRSRAGRLSPLITHQTGRAGLKAGAVRAVLSAREFDVVHFHNMSLMGLDLLKHGRGVKLYTMHEHWLVCPLHVLWKFGREPCSRKACIACQIHAKRPPQLWRLGGYQNAMLRQLDALIAVSRFSRDKHRAMGLDIEIPIEHIPYFVPAPDAVATDPAAPWPRPYFLFVGRLEKMKGVQVLLDAFRRYSACDLLIVGEGKYAAHLRRLASGLPHVQFLGRLGYDRLQSLFRHAVALLVPSIGFETFGIVMLEAFAQKTPVIAHNLGPLPEIIEESNGGLLYGDEAGLTEALDRLRTNPDLRRALGEQGYQAVLKRWAPEPHLRQYFALIERLAAGKANPR
jgi:glycosyltransferase involved in cell wall biosynthesis